MLNYATNQTRSITDFERKLYCSLQAQGALGDLTDVTIRDEYFSITYTRDELEYIGSIVAKEQLQDWLQEQDTDAYIAKQCELAINDKGKERELYGSKIV